MTIDVGDLVKLKNNTCYGELVGVVLATGEQERRMYGDGIEFSPYVDVQWFSSKHSGKAARFTPAIAQLEVISKAEVVE